MERINVLITGQNSYIGNNLARWLAQWPDIYAVDKISLRLPAWKNASFHGYDAVCHMAGLAHLRNAPPETYDAINRALAVEAAEKAKNEGVSRYIFMSTAAVYGVRDVVGQENEIKPSTMPKPTTIYGKSKYAAEAGIRACENETFTVSIVRAPMVYGANCPGNYGRLRRLVLRFGVIPLIENERSMIYIDHLCEYLRLLIHRSEGGVYCPQDDALFCTADVMRWIAEANGRSVVTSQSLGTLIKPAARVLPMIHKAFGNLTYAKSLSVLPINEYCTLSPRDAITATELGWTAK